VACRRLDAVTLADAKVESALAGYECARVDVSKAPGCEKRFDVHGIPLVILLGPDGRELKRQAGYQSPEELLAFLGAPALPAPAAAATPAAAAPAPAALAPAPAPAATPR
jgi:hypothetical protein